MAFRMAWHLARAPQVVVVYGNELLLHMHGVEGTGVDGKLAMTLPADVSGVDKPECDSVLLFTDSGTWACLFSQQGQVHRS